MLRISIVSTNHESMFLRLEGSVSGAWVDELRHVAESALADGLAIVMDCKGVSFIDRRAQRLISELLARKVTLLNCSPFFQSQLRDGL